MARLTPILALLMCAALWGCSDPGCPYGYTKVRGTCLHDDAGSDEADASGGAPAFEAGVEPATGRDAALDATAAVEAGMSADGATLDAATSSSDAASVSDTAVAMDGTAPADASDASATPEASTAVDASSDAPLSCTAGHVLKNGSCQDIDECFEGTHQCHMTSTCKNTAGSYDCECPLGYSGGTSAGFACAPRIAVGSDHACVLLLDGTVQCWGKNAYGQLGDGTQMERTVPVTVSGLRDVAVVSAGSNHSCAILKDATVRCWGANEDGTVGDGTKMNRATPVVVPRLEEIVAIDSASHTCVVQKSGSVKCWGANVTGQLGTGVASDPVLSPVGAAGVSLAANVFLGYNQTCAILRTRAVPCWGEGYLAAPGLTKSLTPVEIPLAGIRTLAFGYRHACSLNIDGKVYCWGTAAIVGTGATGPDVGPTLLPGLSGKGLAIAFYGSYVVRQDGSLAWWHLGTTPTTAPGISGAVAVDAHFNQGCVILDDGTVTCWTLTNPTSAASFNGPVKVSGVDLW